MSKAKVIIKPISFAKEQEIELGYNHQIVGVRPCFDKACLVIVETQTEKTNLPKLKYRIVVVEKGTTFDYRRDMTYVGSFDSCGNQCHYYVFYQKKTT